MVQRSRVWLDNFAGGFNFPHPVILLFRKKDQNSGEQVYFE